MCAYQPKTWVKKRDGAAVPIVKTSPKKFADIDAGELMLIASPAEVSKYIKQIPKGKTSSLAQMRQDLALAWQAHKTCPVTSGIFLRIAAEAAYEEYEQGMPIGKITPFWRIIAPTSPAAKKLSFGTQWLLQQQQKEKLQF
jgi:hypothetical protein